ncbi:MAG: ABC transporter ATP-binding protein [Sedimenticola sp.]|nr:MAG: ABC transporter ATP-binding protein [Sedimenticola sp.]
MNPIIDIENLCKSYKEVKAVNGVSFSIPKGICFGLLGPNGAGKTTTVEMLEGIIEPSSGSIHYRGKPIGPEFRNTAGIMFQNTALQEHITVREALRLFADFYPRVRPMEQLIEQCALGEFLDRDTKRLSGGQRQRVLLAIALINDPEIIFLDEPTTGLDPQARRNFWQLVHKIKAERKTLLLTTHYMEEAYELCDEIAIMDNGRIIAQGTPRDLLKSHFQNTVITLPSTNFRNHPACRDQLVSHQANGYADILSDDVDKTIHLLIDAGVPLTQLQVRERTLEDLFLQLTGHNLRA